MAATTCIICNTFQNQPGDAKQDLWIIQELANRMGLNWDFKGPDEVYDELSGCMESLKNISWERLVNEGAVTYPSDGENKPGNEVIFGEGFPTKNNKGKLVKCCERPTRPL